MEAPLDLNHVSAFVRVVQEGSFTAAARALGLPKSSVSRSIAQLEQDLGVRLLHRTTRKLHLTDAGAAFHDRVARALADIDEATSTTSDLQRELRGSVRVTAPVDLGVWALAGIVARFVRRHPGVHVDVRLSSRIVDLVGEGFDLGIRAGSIRDESLIARRVGGLELGLYASRRYIARRGMPGAPAEVAGHDCIVLRTDTGHMPWTLKDSRGEEVTIDARGSIDADDVSFLKKAVLAGAGIALIPHYLVGREQAAGKLRRVLPDWSFNGALLHIVYPSARYVPQRVVLFRDYLLRGLGRMASRCESLDAPGFRPVSATARVQGDIHA